MKGRKGSSGGSACGDMPKARGGLAHGKHGSDLLKRVGPIKGAAALLHKGRKPRKAGGRIPTVSSPMSGAAHGTPPKGMG